MVVNLLILDYLALESLAGINPTLALVKGKTREELLKEAEYIASNIFMHQLLAAFSRNQPAF